MCIREGKGRNGRCKRLIARALRVARPSRGNNADFALFSSCCMRTRLILQPFFAMGVSLARSLRYQKVVIGVPFGRPSQSFEPSS